MLESRANLRIGEVAERTGVTVRTLHHYEQLGLLVPKHRSEANHRLYGEDELLRLQQILSLRQVGLSLQQIGACLDDPTASPTSVLEQHLDWIAAESDRLGELRGRLQSLMHGIRGRDVTLDQITETIHFTTKMDKYFTKEQQQLMQERHDALSPEKMEEVQKRWADLGAELNHSVEEGVAPTSAEGLEIGRRFRELMEGFSGGDVELEHAVGRMNQAEPQMLEQHGWPTSPESQAFLQEAVHAFMKGR